MHPWHSHAGEAQIHAAAAGSTEKMHNPLKMIAASAKRAPCQSNGNACKAAAAGRVVRVVQEGPSTICVAYTLFLVSSITMNQINMR